MKISCARWQKVNCEKHNKCTSKWQGEHPEEHKKREAKHRLLGFVPLNKSFVGSNGHHVDMERVIYIPTELHRSISHDVRTGRNMDKINALAFQWLEMETP